MARHRTLFFLVSVILLTTCYGTVYSQAVRPGPARTVLPTPHSVLGFVPGEDRKIADWAQITDYFRRLDKASDRIQVEVIGESTLKRPLIAAYISARENIIALPKIKAMQAKLADPRLLNSNAERDRILNEGKAVVAISCSIHSTEIVASQMSMQLAYDLASSQDPAIREILQNTVILLLPSPNPDGIDIVAQWYRKTLGTPFEGKEPPELYHHYAGHDNNRDWFMLNLKETQIVTRLFWKEWFPQVVFDVHQMNGNGARFFIPPYHDPQNPNIDPWIIRQAGLIGHKVAADLQSANVKGVITNSNFDTWWHGGFRTAPYYHNSIGILSEAANARLMSPNTVTREQLLRASSRGMRNALEATTNFPDPWPGGEWRPVDIMKIELSATRSILSLVAKYRRQYLENFHSLNLRAATAQIPKGEPLAYLIPAGQARDEAVARMIKLLIEQGIEVHRLEQELHAGFGPEVLQRTNSASEKLGNYRRIVAHTSGFHEVPAGSYMIFVAQPQRANVLALLQPQIYPQRLNAAGEAERPYDVAGWTVPYQMGVDIQAVVEIKESPAERKLTLVRDANEVRRDLALKLIDGDRSPIGNPLRSATRIGLYKSWVPNMDEGWTRFVFDSFNVPFETLRDSDIRNENISRFDVIVIPAQPPRELLEGHAAGSYPAEFTGGLTAAGINSLKTYVERGGKLVCMDASCDLFVKQLQLPLRNVLEGARASDFYCPGSILSIEMERGHPLARGLPQYVDAYFRNSLAFEATDSSVKAVARYAREGVLRSGWLLGEDKLRGKIAVAEVRVGQGKVILFAFRPQHRGQTWATLPLFWNALTLGE